MIYDIYTCILNMYIEYSRFAGVGISLCPELDVAAVTNGIEDKEAAQVWQFVNITCRLLVV